jgi:Domain of unknown function (DUF4129)
VTDLRTRHTRALLLAAASIVLVGLVAVAAAGHRLGGSSSSRANPYAVDTILTIVIALYIVAAAAVLVGMFWGGLERRRYPRQQTKRQRTLRMAFILVGAAVLVTVGAERYHLRARPRQPLQTPAVQAGKHSVDKKTAAKHASRQPQLRLAPLLAILGAAGIAFAAFLVAEQRRRRRLPHDWNVGEALSDVLEETLDDLRAENDPRRAVIAAYVRMERSLAAHGIPRRRFEAPHEYLTRVLGELSGGRLAAARLTALFERARFSPHEIDAGMKADAIEAIESLQADLAATEAEAEARARAAVAV